MSELKPCPFDSVKKDIGHHPYVQHNSTDLPWVQCTCGAAGPIMATEAQATEAWNTHTPAESPKQTGAAGVDTPVKGGDVDDEDLASSLGDAFVEKYGNHWNERDSTEQLCRFAVNHLKHHLTTTQSAPSVGSVPTVEEMEYAYDIGVRSGGPTGIRGQIVTRGDDPHCRGIDAIRALLTSSTSQPPTAKEGE